MQIKDVDKLKAWLLKKLEPLCDADPAALAKYVVALLRKEKPKAALKELCIDQLEVFLAKETTAFVEKLFRSLESESYIKGEDPPPPSPVQVKAVHVAVSSPVQLSKSDSGDRRQSEDVRHKEVDDDDRDFRRSRRHDPDSPRGGGGGGARKITAPIAGGPGRSSLGKKRNFAEGGSDAISNSKRRIVVEHGRGISEPDIHHRIVLSGPGGSGRRPVRERLGPRSEDSRGERGGRRTRAKRSSRSSSDSTSSTSSSSSSDSSGSDSDSSTGRGRAKKRKVVSASAGNVAVGEGGGVVKRKQRCKDYDKRGFCILGEKCPYDHGLDPLVIDNHINPYMRPPPGLPSMGVPTLPPPELLVPPIIPQGITGRRSPNNANSDSYNPEEPGLTSSSSSSGIIPTHIAPPPPLPLRPLPFPPPHMPPGLMPPHPHNPHLPPFPPHPFPPPPPSSMVPPGPHNMRPRFPLGGPRPNLRPSDSLIVRKIPRELNTITKLSGHFEKFGTIVNLTVRYEGDLEGALVQFSSPAEAKKAHDCAEAVLNNRFIRVSYLRKEEFPMEGPMMPNFHPPRLGPPPHPTSSSFSTSPSLSSFGGGSIATVSSSVPPPVQSPAPDSSEGVGSAETETAASGQHRGESGGSRSNTVDAGDKKVGEIESANSQADHTMPAQPTQTRPHHVPSQQQRRRSAEAAKKNLELQKKTQELLQRQIEQQKLLISKLEKSGKHLSAEEKNKIMKNLKTLSSSITKLTEVANKTVLSQKQEQQRPGGGGGGGPEKKGVEQPNKQQVKALQKAALKEKAEALRQEAHKLGLLSSPSQPLPTTGKGRGKPDLRGKLHGKPRQLLVMGAKERELLTTYFESFGGLDSVAVDPANSNNLIFTFRTSSTANQVVNSSSMFKGKPLIMKWYTPKPSSVAPGPVPSAQAADSTHHHHHHPPPHFPPRQITIEKQASQEVLQTPTTPTLTKLDPQDLHLVEDSDEDEDTKEEGRSWRR